MNPGAVAACSKPDESRVSDIPATVEVPNIPTQDRNLVLSTKFFEAVKG